MMRLCAVHDCQRPAITRGWCEMHYRRWRRHGDPLMVGTPGRPPGFRRLHPSDLEHAYGDVLLRRVERGVKALGLKPREERMVFYRVLGVTQEDIGATLGLARGTVKNTLHGVYQQLGIAQSSVDQTSLGVKLLRLVLEVSLVRGDEAA
jgi:DNA-binding CsgD family transcriptional regulator